MPIDPLNKMRNYVRISLFKISATVLVHMKVSLCSFQANFTGSRCYDGHRVFVVEKGICRCLLIYKSSFTLISYYCLPSFSRLHNHNPPTYETGSTRKFLLGRTDTIRSASIASSEFVKAMVSPNKTVSVAEAF